MLVNHSFDYHFVQLLEKLQKKYGEDMFKLQGIARENLDISRFTNKFLQTKTTADISVDANANVDDMSILSWNYEMPKPLAKLNALYHLWKDALKKHGIKRANKMIQLEIAGGIRIHDLHGWLLPYCWSASLAPIVNDGMPWVKNIKVKPVKHFDTLISNSVKYIYNLSTQCVGAIAVPDFLAYAEYFIRKDYGEEWYNDPKAVRAVRQGFQNWIYGINDKARGNQSLTYNEKIIVDGKPIAIGEFVESYLVSDEMDKAVLDNKYTFTLNRETGRLEANRIKGVIKHKTANKIVEYVLANGAKIKATDNHSFFTRTGLTIEEIQRNSNPTNLLIPFNFINEDSDYSYLSVKQTVGKNPAKDIKLTEDWMYFLGQYLGDGNWDGSTIQIATCNFAVNEVLAELFPEFTYNIRSDFSIRFNMGRNITDAIKNVFNTGSHNKVLPRDWANKKGILHLIGGYIDADGFAPTDGNRGFVLTSVNKELLESVQYILAGYGIMSSIKEKYHNGFNNKLFTTYRLTISAAGSRKLNAYTKFKKVKDNIISNIDSSKLYVDFNGIIKDLDIDINLYKDNLKVRSIQYDHCGIEDIKILVNLLNNAGETEKAKELEKFLYALPIKIIAINDCETQEYVYDISVENNENFLTSSNIYAHNSPFTNVSIFDKYWREAMFGKHTNPDFSLCNLDNLKRTQRMFIDVLIEQQEDNPFTFPVMTGCQLKDKETGEIMDKDWLDWISGISVKNKLINFYTSDSVDSLSSCCRLRNNINPLKKQTEYTNSFGVGGLSIGSHRVVALNLPQIAYMAKYSENDNWQEFFKILESRIRISQDILDIHRETLQKLIKNGNLPMYTYGCMDLTKQYSTIGFIGLFEALQIMGLDIRNRDGIDQGKKIIGLINKLNEQRTAKDGNIRNVEQIPGESAAVTFANKDKLQFANVEYNLYANQYIPLIQDALITDRIRIQGEYDYDVSGGSILHIDIDQELTKEQIKDLIQLCAKQNVIYFALDDCLAQCKSCGKVHVGKFEKSPCHQSDMRYFMRVVGFRTPVESWNKVRRSKDFPNRQMNDINIIHGSDAMA